MPGAQDSSVLSQLAPGVIIFSDVVEWVEPGALQDAGCRARRVCVPARSDHDKFEVVHDLADSAVCITPGNAWTGPRWDAAPVDAQEAGQTVHDAAVHGRRDRDAARDDGRWWGFAVWQCSAPTSLVGVAARGPLLLLPGLFVVEAPPHARTSKAATPTSIHCVIDAWIGDTDAISQRSSTADTSAQGPRNHHVSWLPVVAFDVRAVDASHLLLKRSSADNEEASALDSDGLLNVVWYRDSRANRVPATHSWRLRWMEPTLLQKKKVMKMVQCSTYAAITTSLIGLLELHVSWRASALAEPEHTRCSVSPLLLLQASLTSLVVELRADSGRPMSASIVPPLARLSTTATSTVVMFDSRDGSLSGALSNPRAGTSDGFAISRMSSSIALSRCSRNRARRRPLLCLSDVSLSAAAALDVCDPSSRLVSRVLFVDGVCVLLAARRRIGALADTLSALVNVRTVVLNAYPRGALTLALVAAHIVRAIDGRGKANRPLITGQYTLVNGTAGSLAVAQAGVLAITPAPVLPSGSAMAFSWADATAEVGDVSGCRSARALLVSSASAPGRSLARAATLLLSARLGSLGKCRSGFQSAEHPTAVPISIDYEGACLTRARFMWRVVPSLQSHDLEGQAADPQTVLVAVLPPSIDVAADVVLAPALKHVARISSAGTILFLSPLHVLNATGIALDVRFDPLLTVFGAVAPVAVGPFAAAPVVTPTVLKDYDAVVNDTGGMESAGACKSWMSATRLGTRFYLTVSATAAAENRIDGSPDAQSGSVPPLQNDSAAQSVLIDTSTMPILASDVMPSGWSLSRSTISIRVYQDLHDLPATLTGVPTTSTYAITIVVSVVCRRPRDPSSNVESNFVPAFVSVALLPACILESCDSCSLPEAIAISGSNNVADSTPMSPGLFITCCRDARVIPLSMSTVISVSAAADSADAKMHLPHVGTAETEARLSAAGRALVGLLYDSAHIGPSISVSRLWQAARVGADANMVTDPWLIVDSERKVVLGVVVSKPAIATVCTAGVSLQSDRVGAVFCVVPSVSVHNYLTNDIMASWILSPTKLDMRGAAAHVGIIRSQPPWLAQVIRSQSSATFALPLASLWSPDGKLGEGKRVWAVMNLRWVTSATSEAATDVALRVPDAMSHSECCGAVIPVDDESEDVADVRALRIGMPVLLRLSRRIDSYKTSSTSALGAAALAPALNQTCGGLILDIYPRVLVYNRTSMRLRMQSMTAINGIHASMDLPPCAGDAAGVPVPICMAWASTCAPRAVVRFATALSPTMTSESCTSAAESNPLVIRIADLEPSQVISSMRRKRLDVDAILTTPQLDAAAYAELRLLALLPSLPVGHSVRLPLFALSDGSATAAAEVVIVLTIDVLADPSHPGCVCIVVRCDDAASPPVHLRNASESQLLLRLRHCPQLLPAHAAWMARELLPLDDAVAMLATELANFELRCRMRREVLSHAALSAASSIAMQSLDDAEMSCAAAKLDLARVRSIMENSAAGAAGLAPPPGLQEAASLVAEPLTRHPLLSSVYLSHASPAIILRPGASLGFDWLLLASTGIVGMPPPYGQASSGHEFVFSPAPLCPAFPVTWTGSFDGATVPQRPTGASGAHVSTSRFRSFGTVPSEISADDDALRHMYQLLQVGRLVRDDEFGSSTSVVEWGEPTWLREGSCTVRAEGGEDPVDNTPLVRITSRLQSGTLEVVLDDGVDVSVPNRITSWPSRTGSVSIHIGHAVVVVYNASTIALHRNGLGDAANEGAAESAWRHACSGPPAAFDADAAFSSDCPSSSPPRRASVGHEPTPPLHIATSVLALAIHGFYVGVAVTDASSADVDAADGELSHGDGSRRARVLCAAEAVVLELRRPGGERDQLLRLPARGSRTAALPGAESDGLSIEGASEGIIPSVPSAACILAIDMRRGEMAGAHFRGVEAGLVNIATGGGASFGRPKHRAWIATVVDADVSSSALAITSEHAVILHKNVSQWAVHVARTAVALVTPAHVHHDALRGSRGSTNVCNRVSINASSALQAPPVVVALDRLSIRLGTAWVSVRWSGPPLPAPIFLSFSGIPLSISEIVLRRPLLTPRALLRDVAANVVADVIVRVPAVLGSLELLGNPTALIQELADGVATALLTPLRLASAMFVPDPDAIETERARVSLLTLLGRPLVAVATVAGGLASGVVSLTGKVIYGSLSSVGALSTSLGENLQGLARLEAVAVIAASRAAGMSAGPLGVSTALAMEDIPELAFSHDDFGEEGDLTRATTTATPTLSTNRFYVMRGIVSAASSALLLLGNASTRLASAIQDDVDEVQMGGAAIYNMPLRDSS